MSDRTFKWAFVIFYALIATWYQPYIDLMVVCFLAVGCASAYVIAANFPQWVRNKQAEIDAWKGQ